MPETQSGTMRLYVCAAERIGPDTLLGHFLWREVCREDVMLGHEVKQIM
jgi:hypothetical protein